MSQKSTKEVRMYLRIRNLCGLLGIILPWLALFSAGIILDKPEGWWWSISATYYQSPALVGVLVPACIVMMSYIGYDWKDNLITTLTGLFGLGIVLFPCKVDWIADGTAVGFFQLPIELSQIVHTACALLFFLCAAINTLCQFTRHGDTMTDRKKVRNTIYRICGWGMIGLEAGSPPRRARPPGSAGLGGDGHRNPPPAPVRLRLDRQGRILPLPQRPGNHPRPRRPHHRRISPAPIHKTPASHEAGVLCVRSDD